MQIDNQYQDKEDGKQETTCLHDNDNEKTVPGWENAHCRRQIAAQGANRVGNDIAGKKGQQNMDVADRTLIVEFGGHSCGTDQAAKPGRHNGQYFGREKGSRDFRDKIFPDLEKTGFVQVGNQNIQGNRDADYANNNFSGPSTRFP